MGHRASAVVVIAFIAACGDPDQQVGDRPDAGPSEVDAAAPPDGSAAVTIDDVCGPDGAFADLFGRLLACNPAFDVLFAQGRLDATALSIVCYGAFGPYLGDGSIGLPTRAQLDACAAYLEDTPCVDVELILSSGPCDVLIGQIADAGDCEITEQCSNVSYCERSGPGCGACTARGVDGASCMFDDQCVGGACIGAQCGHLGDDGDPCVIGGGGDDGSADCLGQRVCDPATNRCASPRVWQVNDVCAQGTGDCDPFATGLFCGAAAQCTPLLGLGDTCRSGGNDVGFCDVRSYLTCPAGDDVECRVPVIQASEDDSCGLFAGEQCAAGLTCTDVINGGVCIDYQAAGETCDAGPGAAETDQCDLFLGCLDDGVTSSCVYSAYSGACPP